MDLSFLDGIRSKLSGQPFNLEFAVTRNCNSRCGICNQWKKDWGDELSTSEIWRIFQSYNGFSVVGITGGEPTLRKDLSQILKIVDDTQPNLKRLFLTSNGFLPEKLHDDLLDFLSWSRSDVKTTVLISIDGNREIHNFVRGRTFAYDRAVESLERLAVLRDSYPFELGTVTTYGSMNYEHYNQVLQEIQDLKERFDLSPAFCFIWHGSLYDKNNPGCLDYWEAIKKDRFKIMRALQGSDRLLNARSLFWLFTSRFAAAEGYQVLPCEGANVRYFMDSVGKIYPCIIWDRVLADLRELDYDLKKVFSCSEKKAARHIIRLKSCPGCYVTCEFIPTMMSHPLGLLWIYLREKFGSL